MMMTVPKVSAETENCGGVRKDVVSSERVVNVIPQIRRRGFGSGCGCGIVDEKMLVKKRLKVERSNELVQDLINLMQSQRKEIDVLKAEVEKKISEIERLERAYGLIGDEVEVYGSMGEEKERTIWPNCNWDSNSSSKASQETD